MAYLPNVERSAFRTGQYVGYCGGDVYHIVQVNRRSGWRAVSRSGESVIRGRTLTEVSSKLSALAAEIGA